MIYSSVGGCDARDENNFVIARHFQRVFQKMSNPASFAMAMMALMHRVARWFIFKPKITIWVNLGGP
jgi:hypothetical protein